MSTENSKSKGMMKAAICREAGKPLVFEEIPIPQPKERELLVKVKAASLCHTDLAFMAGAYGTRFPIVAGHEGVCVVEQLGPEAGSYGFKVGDLVGASPFHDMCMKCIECRTAGPDFCRNARMKGHSVNGYFSEYSLVDAASAVVLPASMGSEDALRSLAPLFCAGITAWDALERAKIGLGETIAIIGMGGVGQLVAQYAHSFGARVIALDIHDEQLIASKQAGIVDETINSRSLPEDEVIGKVFEANNGYPIDHALVATDVVATYTLAIKLLKAQGQLVVVGLPAEPIPFDGAHISLRGIRITGAKVAGQKCVERCVNFSARKGILPKVNSRKFKLEDLNEMVDLMKAGRTEEGRMVVEFSS